MSRLQVPDHFLIEATFRPAESPCDSSIAIDRRPRPTQAPARLSSTATRRPSPCLRARLRRVNAVRARSRGEERSSGDRPLQPRRREDHLRPRSRLQPDESRSPSPVDREIESQAPFRKIIETVNKFPSISIWYKNSTQSVASSGARLTRVNGGAEGPQNNVRLPTRLALRPSAVSAAKPITACRWLVCGAPTRRDEPPTERCGRPRRR